MVYLIFLVLMGSYDAAYDRAGFDFYVWPYPGPWPDADETTDDTVRTNYYVFADNGLGANVTVFTDNAVI